MAEANFSESTVSMANRFGVPGQGEYESELNPIIEQNKLTCNLVGFVTLQVSDEMPLYFRTLFLNCHIGGFIVHFLNLQNEEIN